MREYWDDTTEALYSDIGDLLAQHLKSAIEEKPPYVKFEGQDVTAHNPGWLNAALVAVEMVCGIGSVPQNLKQVLIVLRDKKLNPIMLATSRLVQDEPDSESLQNLYELYEDLFFKLDMLIEG